MPSRNLVSLWVHPGNSHSSESIKVYFSHFACKLFPFIHRHYKVSCVFISQGSLTAKTNSPTLWWSVPMAPLSNLFYSQWFRTRFLPTHGLASHDLQGLRCIFCILPAVREVCLALYDGQGWFIDRSEKGQKGFLPFIPTFYQLGNGVWYLRDRHHPISFSSLHCPHPCIHGMLWQPPNTKGSATLMETVPLYTHMCTKTTTVCVGAMFLCLQNGGSKSKVKENTVTFLYVSGRRKAMNSSP